MVRELQAKRDLLYLETENMPLVRIFKTPASFYSFWDVRATFGKRMPDGKVIHSADDLAEYFIHSAGAITASGTGFMQDGFLRLSFSTPEEHITGGMRAIRKALNDLK
jgi:aspartate aminotransferase